MKPSARLGKKRREGSSGRIHAAPLVVDARAVVESGLRSGRKHASVQVTEKGQGSFMKDTRATAKGNNRIKGSRRADLP